MIFQICFIGAEGSSARKVNNCSDDSDLGISNEKKATTTIGDSKSTSFPEDAGPKSLEESVETEKKRSLLVRSEGDNNILLHQQVTSKSGPQKKKKEKASKGAGSSAQTVYYEGDIEKEGPSLTATSPEGI